MTKLTMKYLYSCQELKEIKCYFRLSETNKEIRLSGLFEDHLHHLKMIFSSLENDFFSTRII